MSADEEGACVTQHILLVQLSLKAAMSRCLPPSVQAALSHLAITSFPKGNGLTSERADQCNLS